MDIRHILTQLEMLNTLIAEIEARCETALGRIPYKLKVAFYKTGLE